MGDSGHYFQIVPASCGVLGENTVFDQSVTPFCLERLHVLFQLNTSEPLLRVAGALLICERAVSSLAKVSATGYQIEEIEVEVDEQIAMVGAWKGGDIDCYKWLKVEGIAMKDDFGKLKHRLIVSERVANILQQEGLENARIHAT